jgi:hypothetical protein
MIAKLGKPATAQGKQQQGRQKKLGHRKCQHLEIFRRYSWKTITMADICEKTKN